MLASVHAARRRRKQEQLDEAYKKAVKQAEGKGRQIPAKNEYYYVDTWGYPYMMYGPWQAYPCSGYLYVAGDPCIIPGEGMPGNCVAGACVGDVGTGACGSACGSACGDGGEFLSYFYLLLNLKIENASLTGLILGGCGGGCGGCGG